MRKFVPIALVGLLSFGISFAAVKKVPKGEKNIHRFERAPSEHSVLGHGSSKITMPNTRNAGYFTLVDSASNGYGMVSAATRPLFVDPENTGYWFSTYRQFYQELGSHGQLGGAFSEDGESWEVYFNLNANGNPPWGGGGIGCGEAGSLGGGCSQARYPSAIGTEDIPIAMWTEYTGDTSSGSLYGGRPYYAFDDFGWEGGSFAYPVDVDLLWNTDAKDLWVGSIAVSYNDDGPVINAAFNDWTRDNKYLFQSEYVDDATIIMGEENLIINEQADLTPGDAAGSFNTSPYVSCTPEGVCGVGIVGLFPGGETDVSEISNNHTGIFRMSEDHGATWMGGTSGDVTLGHAPSVDGIGYYFIPDNVFDDLLNTQFMYEITDECEGTTDMINDFWTYYEDDFKVDRNGNPHFSIQLLGCGAEFCYYEPNSGWYHFTIDKDYLDNPGPVNTDTGWNWSFVMSGTTTWNWTEMTGNSYVSSTHGSLAFSVENPDVMYMVTNMATGGNDDDYAGDPANLEDPCYFATWADYPTWSEDIYVVKSEDGGRTWWNPLNITNTPDESGGICPNGYPKCDPAEQFPHAAQWATDEQVFIQYQMPNWEFNEIGDLLGADFMNRLYIGWAEVTDSDIPEYYVPGESTPSCYAEVGDITADGILNVLDIISLVNHILGVSPLLDTCAADYQPDTVINVLDIVGMVNYILGIGLQSSIVEPPATEVVIHASDKLYLESNGNVQAVHLVLSSDNELDIQFSENYIVESHYDAVTGKTTMIIVSNNLNLNEIAEISGKYEVVEYEVVTYDDSIKNSVMIDNNSIGLNQSPAGSNALPNGYRVSSAYPNPFNPMTSFNIDLDQESFVSIKAYNILGQLIADVFSGNIQAGYGNQISWDASNVSSGIYFMQIQVDDNLESQKVLLVK